MQWCCYKAKLMTETSYDSLLGPYLHGMPNSGGVIKAEPEHFQVVEELELPQQDPQLQQGEHQWLWVRKRGANTPYVAAQLAKFAGVKERDVSYSGLKDRQAITEQWFSIQLPGQQLLPWHELEHPEFSVLQAVLQPRKLKTGTHKRNRFTIRIEAITDADAFNQRWQQVCTQGVPNYYGLQRFGKDGQNISNAVEWLSGRLRRRLNRTQIGLYLSAARSFLFNQVLAERIRHNLLTPLEGEPMLLSGSQSFFIAEQIDAALLERLASGDIELSGPLMGSGERQQISQAQAAELEQRVFAQYPELLQGLAKQRLDGGRRALLLRPQQAQLNWLSDTVAEISFALPKGCFATALIRELVTTE